MRLIVLIAPLFALAACAEWDRDFDTMKHGNAGVTYEVQTGQMRQAPALDSTRKVADVDCGKPFDPTAGNVRCR